MKTKLIKAWDAPLYIPGPDADLSGADLFDDAFTRPLAACCEFFDDDGNPVDEKALSEILFPVFSGRVIAEAEEAVKTVFGDVITDFDRECPLPCENLYLNTAMTREKMPYPSDEIFYTPAYDVIPQAKRFYSGDKTAADALFAGIGLCFAPDATGIAFPDAAALKAFHAAFRKTAKARFAGDSLARALNLCAYQADDACACDMLTLRDDPDDEQEPGSLARVYFAELENWALAHEKWLIMPFSAAESLNPEKILFVNLLATTKSPAEELTLHWKGVLDASRGQAVFFSKDNLTTPARFSINKKHAAERARDFENERMAGNSGVLKEKFSKERCQSANLAAGIRRLMARAGRCPQSLNMQKTEKRSFMRANRRDPFNLNLAGRAASMHYYPDIHLYIDSSGSISKENYENAVITAIRLAKKLGIDLYISYFSHELGPAWHLPCRCLSEKELIRRFEAVGRVGGGTEYENIWKAVAASPKRRRELSIIITDFEYDPPSSKVHHPKNIYYAPCDGLRAESLMRSANEFVRAMAHIDAHIAGKILM